MGGVVPPGELAGGVREQRRPPLPSDMVDREPCEVCGGTGFLRFCGGAGPHEWERVYLHSGADPCPACNPQGRVLSALHSSASRAEP